MSLFCRDLNPFDLSFPLSIIKFSANFSTSNSALPSAELASGSPATSAVESQVKSLACPLAQPQHLLDALPQL